MRGSDPTLFLSVTDAKGKPVKTPYFAAMHVTSGLVARLRKLARLCQMHRIAWLATQYCPPPVYWHVSDDVMTEQTSEFCLVGTSIYIELSARRRVVGGYGRLEVIGQTPVFDLAELMHMRKQRIVLDFREHESKDDARGEPFALEVIRRLRCVGVWPSTVPLDETPTEGAQ